MEKWLKQFKENYEGKSPEAKALEPFLKENYKGDVYIPWAVMERLTYMQDPYADFEVVKNEKNNIVHRDYYKVETYSKTGDKEIHTQADVFTHFVIVRLTFLGKTFEETYPIQDNSYEAPKVINQNMINKALQRAKAKIASRATGLGFKLYEGGDLQFNNDDKPKTNTVNKTQISKNDKTQTLKVEQTTTNKVDEPVNNINEEPTVEINKEVWKLASFLHKNEDVLVGIQRINTSVAAKYGFVFDINDDVEVIYDKLSKVANPATFIRSIKVQSGLPIE